MNKNGFLEVRTKSGNIDVLKDNKQLKNVIVAYSLNPQKIIDNFLCYLETKIIFFQQ